MLSQTTTMTTNIKRCARCGNDHEDLPMKDMSNSDRFSHWAECPTNGQPILIKIIIDDD